MKAISYISYIYIIYLFLRKKEKDKECLWSEQNCVKEDIVFGYLVRDFQVPKPEPGRSQEGQTLTPLSKK